MICVEIKVRAPHAIDATLTCDRVCSMAEVHEGLRTLTHWLMSPQAAAAKESAKNAAFEKAEARRRVR